jgi:hypothetical protein
VPDRFAGGTTCQNHLAASRELTGGGWQPAIFSSSVSGIDPRTDIETDRRPIGVRINASYTAASAASGARRGAPDSIMGFRTAKSTIIPAVFDLAPNRQITANWQIRRHGAGRGDSRHLETQNPPWKAGRCPAKPGMILSDNSIFPEKLTRCKRLFAPRSRFA